MNNIKKNKKKMHFFHTISHISYIHISGIFIENINPGPSL